MPRSFLVKKHHGRRATHGRVEPDPEDTHKAPPPTSPTLHHRGQAPIPRLHQRSSSLSSSSSSSSSCPLSLQTDRETRPESLLPPSLPFLTLFPTGPPGVVDETLECLGCGKERLSLSGLTDHQQLRCDWSSRKSFSCKYCEKEYVSLGALKMHIRTHTLPCVCKLCGKAFSRPWLLQGHIRTHTGEKPFSCLHCSRAFADRSNLRAHLQTHSDVKKYRCVRCFKTFSRISLLAKHQEAGCPMS